MAWNAKVKTIGPVGADGRIEVTFDVLLDDVVKYSNRSIYAPADIAVERIRGVVQRLKDQNTAAGQIQPNQVINLV